LIRRYDYECQKCKTVFEIEHEINDEKKIARCPKCKKKVKVTKLISFTTFRITWDTNY